jgi:hypothetical protein
MTDYATFLATKTPRQAASGITVASGLNPKLFDWQQEIVRWALKRGRAAIFADCGLGKGPMALEWARHVAAFTGRPALILAPLAVAQQFAREGAKFGVPVTICRSGADLRPGVNVTNYEMLAHFTAGGVAGIVLDESSILKNFMGKTKRLLVEMWAATPYRLCCTATPAPNDHMEIGNHAEFLGIMPSNEMLTRWFINDTSRTGEYRLKGHAVADFWRWVSTWAVATRTPADLGYPANRYILPPLHHQTITVPVDRLTNAGDQLFRTPEMSATSLHRELRLTAPARAEVVAGLVNGSADAWLVWCNTEYEATELTRRIPAAREVKGSQTIGQKEATLADFIDGRLRVLISKPSICGLGLNLQHCHNAVFTGLSYSYEQSYQATRRIYRFGQTESVHVYEVLAETETAILSTLAVKRAAHEEMMTHMIRYQQGLAPSADLTLAAYEPRMPMALPPWLRSVA